ncbi:MAG TPA: GNAT family N-acetyltransferase [Candidatus Angelobacter sp.]|nr:GNAT family N-acetyltransferase [Candidatus Angelobacter sp.]
MTRATATVLAPPSADATSAPVPAGIRATRADMETVGDVLARAFDDDPLMRHLFRTDRHRTTALRRLFRRAALEALPHGEVYLTQAGDAAAICYPPSAPRETLLGTLRLLPAMAYAGGLRRLPTLLRTLSWIEEHHPKDPHLYVMFMGVVPERQGRGIGRSLLQAILDAPALAGSPAYLEASTPDNARLYQRLGFRAMGDLPLPDGGPVLRPMWREATRR